MEQFFTIPLPSLGIYKSYILTLIFYNHPLVEYPQVRRNNFVSNPIKENIKIYTVQNTNSKLISLEVPL